MGGGYIPCTFRPLCFACIFQFTPPRKKNNLSGKPILICVFSGGWTGGCSISSRSCRKSHIHFFQYFFYRRSFFCFGNHTATADKHAETGFHTSLPAEKFDNAGSFFIDIRFRKSAVYDGIHIRGFLLFV
jgi:hypothetical protein